MNNGAGSSPLSQQMGSNSFSSGSVNSRTNADGSEGNKWLLPGVIGGLAASAALLAATADQWQPAFEQSTMGKAFVGEASKIIDEFKREVKSLENPGNTVNNAASAPFRQPETKPAPPTVNSNQASSSTSTTEAPKAVVENKAATPPPPGPVLPTTQTPPVKQEAKPEVKAETSQPKPEVKSEAPVAPKPEVKAEAPEATAAPKPAAPEAPKSEVKPQEAKPADTPKAEASSSPNNQVANDGPSPDQHGRI